MKQAAKEYLKIILNLSVRSDKALDLNNGPD